MVEDRSVVNSRLHNEMTNSFIKMINMDELSTVRLSVTDNDSLMGHELVVIGG